MKNIFELLNTDAQPFLLASRVKLHSTFLTQQHHHKGITMSGQRARQLITAAYAQYANDAVSTIAASAHFDLPSLLK